MMRARRGGFDTHDFHRASFGIPFPNFDSTWTEVHGDRGWVSSRMRIWFTRVLPHKPPRSAEVLEGQRTIKWVRRGKWCNPLPPGNQLQWQGLVAGISSSHESSSLSFIERRKQSESKRSCSQLSWIHYIKKVDLSGTTAVLYPQISCLGLRISFC